MEKGTYVCFALRTIGNVGSIVRGQCVERKELWHIGSLQYTCSEPTYTRLGRGRGGSILEVPSHYVACIGARACVGQWSLSVDLALQREIGLSQISLLLNWENCCLEYWTIQQRFCIFISLCFQYSTHWRLIFFQHYYLFSFYIHMFKEDTQTYEHFSFLNTKILSTKICKYSSILLYLLSKTIQRHAFTHSYNKTKFNHKN